MKPSAFQALARLSFGRLLDDDIIGAEGNDINRLAQVLGMLAVPGAFHSIYIALHYSVFHIDAFRTPLGTTDRYGFLCYSMVVIGFAAVIEWDALFPDRRDFLILTPLPLSTGRLFAAKLLALTFYVGLFGLAANACSTVLFPMVSASRVSASEFVQIVAAHAFSVGAIGAFVALGLGAVQGILLNLTSASVFRRVSEWLRMSILAFLTMCALILPFLSFAVPSLVEQGHSILHIFPPFWFLGLYESLLPGGATNPVLDELAATGWKALGASGLNFLVTYAFAYRKHARRILEEAASVPGGLANLAPRTWPRTPLERAAFDFVHKTMTRSARHRLCVSAFTGVALGFCLLTAYDIALGADGLVVTLSLSGIRSVPLILCFFIITGIRASFAIPAELRANWVFQISADDVAGLFGGVRKWLFTRVVAPLSIGGLLLSQSLFSIGDTLVQASFNLLLTLALVEIIFFPSGKFPFTYSNARMSWNCVGTVTMYVGCLWLFAFHSIVQPWLTLLCFGTAAALTSIWKARHPSPMIFEEEADPAVRTLNLRLES